MNHLLILTDQADKYLELLRKCELPDLEAVACAHEEKARQAIRCSNIVLGEPAMIANVLSEARCLEWVQSTFAGVEALCVEGLRRDYILTGVRGVHGPMMSEYVLAYILAIERRLFETKENQNAKAWIEFSYRRLRGLTLGICGLGSIGRHLAQTAHHFGMRVMAFKRTPGEIPYVEQVYTGASFGKFLGLLDYLVLVLPNTPDTTGLINSETLKKLKPSAVLMNVGRGNAIVEADLVYALKNRLIRAAVLDVFSEEPLPSNSPFWDLPNVLITPHNSAISFAEDILPVFCKNYHCFLQKKPLNYVIDFKRGY
jgi:phosphoglycerate dehydrogenase-like enzyme